MLDDLDYKILAFLQENSKLTIREIASQLHLSTTPIFERIKRLEKSGVISKYVALLSAEKLEKNLVAFVDISLKDHGKDAVEHFVNEIIKFSEVQECHHVTGQADIIIKVLLKNISEYNDFVLNKLSIVPNIGKLESRFSLSVRKNSTVIDLNS